MTYNWFYNSEEYITTKDALLEAKNIVGTKTIIELLNDKQAKKIFREEIFPIIKFCELIEAKEVLFCGHKNNSIDAVIKDKDNKTINVECTTSINAHYKELLYEYNIQYFSCSIGPHSKAFEIDNIDKAGNNDIVYSGSKHKRMFIEQEKLNNENSFESCIVDINKYAQEDIKKIKQKIDKGINENLYKNFILILTCEHSIDIQQIREYQNLLCNYWESVIDNPFAGLFIVNYDSLLFMQTKQDASYDSTHTPIPILFKND